MRKTRKKTKTQPEQTKSTGKNLKLYQNLLKVTEQYVSGKRYSTPLSPTDLMSRLGFPPQHEEIFVEVIQALTAQGVIKEQEGQIHPLKQKPLGEYTKGVIRMHARGFGFVQPEESDKYPQDIFIPKPFTQNAVDGDTVEVLIVPESLYSEKGPEGKVITILSRGRTHLSGIVKAIEPYGDIVVYAPMLGMSQRVVMKVEDETRLNVGDRIVMRVTEWGAKDTETEGSFSFLIGHIDDASVDNDAAIEQFELRSQFPKSVLKEAKSFGDRVKPSEIQDREDLRDLVSVTIDPTTAKDFDDALSLSKDKKGHYHLGVHIADVSHYVKEGSALDREAKMRCNSTYLPGHVIPMLPHELSSHLCSLKANVNRLTLSVMVHFNAEGDLVDYRIVRSVIKSVKRFTYREAKEVLDGKKKSPHLGLLNLMVELCHLLKRKRYERGSIEFALPELEILVDETGTPTGTDYIAYDITHQLVEEFMLKANEIVAWHLSNMGKNLTYRVHGEPAEDNLRDFAMLAGAFGFKVSDKPTPMELQKLFEEATDSPYISYLATSYIRRMRLAVYSPDNIGHYGLALTHYCHFTSPIRRYVDLVVHRILFGDNDDREQLDAIAEACSTQERISAKAEMNVKLLKKLRLLAATYAKERYKEYEAIITSIKPFGIYFDVLDFMVEGFVHISQIGQDYYVYSESPTSMLEGRRSRERYRSGDKVRVILKEVNLITLESSWYVANHEESMIELQKPKKKGKIKFKKSKPVLAPEEKLAKKPKKKPEGKKTEHTPKGEKKTKSAKEPKEVKKPEKIKVAPKTLEESVKRTSDKPPMNVTKPLPAPRGIVALATQGKSKRKK